MTESSTKAPNNLLDGVADILRDVQPLSGGLWFISLWQKSVMGRTVTEIKSDPAEVKHFAEAVSDFLVSILSSALTGGHWCNTQEHA